MPGAADRILTMSEAQVKHRHALETQLVDADRRGQNFGFILGFVGLIGSFALLFLEKNLAGLTTFVTALGSLVGIYIYGKKKTS